jgi:DNA processing protein
MTEVGLGTLLCGVPMSSSSSDPSLHADSEQVSYVALSLAPFSWRRRMAEHLHAGDLPARILEQLSAEQHPDRAIDRRTLSSKARAALTRARSSGITLVTWGDAMYPAALSAIVDPPPALWVRGNIAALSGPAVAIVGSRAASSYGLTVAERLGAELAARGVVIVSGLARGVDSAAHRGALAGPGATVGVLGSGADVIYPAEHRSLARDIEVQGGAIVSELVPGTPPQPQFFPLRNRIISGLSRAVLIVEAGEKSGSLITARCALDQGRDVLAVPGNVLSGRNRGGHALLRDGAKIVESADDILEELGMPAPERPGRPATDGPLDPVLRGLPAGESCDLEAISERTGLTAARLLPKLFDLEMRGLVRRVGGGRFARV